MNNVIKSIGWAHYTCNPVKGICPVGCSYCFARKFYQRKCNEVFKNPLIRYEEKAWVGLDKIPSESRVFVGSTMELFHDKTKQYIPRIFEYCQERKDVTFIFLTKQPQNLPLKFPDNCWVGVSCTNSKQFIEAHRYLAENTKNITFISFEPLLERIVPFDEWLLPVYLTECADWIIIGQCTPINKNTMPKKEWVDEIIKSAGEVNIPIFLKNNLLPLYEKRIIQIGRTMPISRIEDSIKSGKFWRQEFPKVKEGR